MIIKGFKKYIFDNSEVSGIMTSIKFFPGERFRDNTT